MLLCEWKWKDSLNFTEIVHFKQSRTGCFKSLFNFAHNLVLDLRETQKALQLQFFFFFFFSFGLLLVNGLAKLFLCNYRQLLLQTCVTKVGGVSLDTLANYCAQVLKLSLSLFSLSVCVCVCVCVCVWVIDSMAFHVL